MAQNMLKRTYPQEIDEACCRYRKCTDRALRRLLCLAKSFGLNSETRISISELNALGRRFKDSSTEIPDDVAFDLREAISSRKRVTRFHHENWDTTPKDIEATLKHEKFTNT